MQSEANEENENSQGENLSIIKKDSKINQSIYSKKETLNNNNSQYEDNFEEEEPKEENEMENENECS